MPLAIDMVGTNLNSATKNYNINFCKYLSKLSLKKKIYIFISKDYLKYLNKNYNPKIYYITKSNYLSHIFFRFLWMQFFLPFELKKLKIKKLFSPMNFGPIFLKYFNIKLILGLHSNLPWVYFEKMPGNYFRKIFTKLVMEKSIQQSERLIVTSNYAKKEIIKFLSLDEKKVFKVYLGIDDEFYKKTNKYFLKDFIYKNYILSVISCVKYHNILNLLKAFKLLRKKEKKIKFVLVMSILDKKYFLKIDKFIKKNFISNEIIIFNNLQNKYLLNLYKNSKLYIFSSYCEVFGLTSLEAMSQKSPVLMSNKSALPEINGNAVYYYNPDKIYETFIGMLELINNKGLRKRKISKGFIHFTKFNWKNTVKKTLEILEI